MRLDLTTIPLIGRDDFDELLSQGAFEPYSHYAVEMNRNGFCRVNLKSARFDRLCNLAMTRLAEGFCQDLALWRLKKGPPPRQQDAWKRIREPLIKTA
jgi:hypothetical protein